MILFGSNCRLLKTRNLMLFFIIFMAFFQLFYAFLIFPRWPYLASQFISLCCPVGPLRKLTLVTFDRYIARALVFPTVLSLSI